MTFPRPEPTWIPGPQPVTSSTDDAQRRAAALTVADRSLDADDCRRLLDVLGLLP